MEERNEHRMMSLKDRLIAFVKKYKHAWVLSYGLVYAVWFGFLENHVTTQYHVIETALDRVIPFVPVFIVPYLLWFPLIAWGLAWFFFKDVDGFYRLAGILIAGMTIFLIICTLYPNGQNLRPAVVEGENIFADLVRMIYATDTCTNVFPSLHVYNTLCVCMAVYHSDRLSSNRLCCVIVYGLSALIVLSTVFLKQHSVLDVVGAFVMAFALCPLVYERKHAGNMENRPAFLRR